MAICTRMNLTCLIIIYSGTSWVVPILRPHPRSFMSLLFSFFRTPSSGSPPFGAQVFTLYSPSRLILTLHLFIRQVPIQIPVPSATSPCFLLVALTKATLFRHLFSLIWLGRLWVHSMQRWRIHLEPPPSVPPCESHSTRLFFWGHFGGSLQRDVTLPFEVLGCRGQGHPRLRL